MDYYVAVAGASWGGLDAFIKLVEGLPAAFSIPLVLVQHRGKEPEAHLADLLQDRTELSVHEPEDKEPLQPGHVYVAPADYHLLVDRGFLALETDAPVRYSRPSIDVTFTSAAEVYGSGVIGIVLTGANADGSRGLRCVADRGGYAIVQDPDTAGMPVMPRAARAAVPESTVLPVELIAARLVELAGVRGKTARR